MTMLLFVFMFTGRRHRLDRAAIFIPITFVAGIYGMNFKNMPELEWPWGYGLAWVIMGEIAIAVIVLFKTKKWL